MGQIVFVVAAEQTPPHAVTEAVDLIPDDKVVGMVLNKARRNPLDRFGYAYGYGYGHCALRTKTKNRHFWRQQMAESLQKRWLPMECI